MELVAEIKYELHELQLSMKELIMTLGCAFKKSYLLNTGQCGY